MQIHHPAEHILSLDLIRKLLQEDANLSLAPNTRNKVEANHKWMMKHIQDAKNPVYGINTGFGALCNVKISYEHLSILQENLLRSHACGTGAEVPEPICRLMLLLKIEALSKGYSGVSCTLIEHLMDWYNRGITPLIYEQGSLGASGDLAPLAHLALPLLQEGRVYFEGRIREASELGMTRHYFLPKEGLALINGTQFMTAYGAWILLQAERLLDMADEIAALSLEAFDGCIDAFLPLSHQIRPHRGQRLSAERILNAVKGSELIYRSKEHVQDPYSFRCAPQVHGASRDVVMHVREVFETEMNSVTDNPNVFADEGLILSAGNFHGQPLAMRLDFLAIALSELGSISERRIYKLMEGQRGLPAFLTRKSGLNSGFMIAQYTAASIASQNKQYCTPASADSLVSSNGQEDHVSMGANAATKCLRVLENTIQILAIEAMSAAQAFEFRRPLFGGERSEVLFEEIRSRVPFIQNDEYMHPHLINMRNWLQDQILEQ